jgi:acyl-coenzyme A thioesterase PaaI-like protein
MEGEELVFPRDGGCFGCSDSNPAGLRLRFWRRGDVVVSPIAIDDRFHGAPGIAHGGIVATILDEVSCAAATFLAGFWVVTGELSVRYLRPCPVGTPLEVEGRIVDRSHPRYLVIEGVVRAGDEILARSTGRFFPQERTEDAP